MKIKQHAIEQPMGKQRNQKINQKYLELNEIENPKSKPMDAA